MSVDPAGFVKRWVSSQKRDLDTLSGETGGNVEDEEMRRREFFEKVGENVYLLLARQKVQQGQQG